MQNPIQLNDAPAAGGQLIFDGNNSSNAVDAMASQARGAMQQLFRRKANRKQLLLVFRQLALLVETGIDITEALELAADSCRQATLRDSLYDIHDDINSGKSIGLAVAAQEEVLGKGVTASIQAGEVSGKLAEVLQQIADQLEEELNARSTIASSLAYPGILCTAAIAVGGILVWFVLPQFESSFESMGFEPPAFTKFLFSVSDVIRTHVALISAGLVLGLVVAIAGLMQRSTKDLLVKLCYRTPLLGPTLRNLAVGRLFLSMGHLLSNGISLLEAIQLAQNSATSGDIKNLVDTWEDDVLEGKGLSHSLEDFTFLPDGSHAMLIMAEKTGRLERVLVTAGTHYRAEGTSQLKQLLKLSEPLIIIGLGLFVGVVVASVLMPMLDVQAGAGA